MKIKVERISKKEGSNNKGNYEQKWVKFGFLSNEKWYGCFDKDYKEICSYNGINEVKEGDIIECDCTEVERNGTIFNNISAPSLQLQLNFLKERLRKLEVIAEAGKLFNNKKPVIDKVIDKGTHKDIEISFENEEDVPF
jgi:hypothetical protein